jgi:hypothetical protein
MKKLKLAQYEMLQVFIENKNVNYILFSLNTKPQTFRLDLSECKHFTIALDSSMNYFHNKTNLRYKLVLDQFSKLPFIKNYVENYVFKKDVRIDLILDLCSFNDDSLYLLYDIVLAFPITHLRIDYKSGDLDTYSLGLKAEFIQTLMSLRTLRCLQIMKYQYSPEILINNLDLLTPNEEDKEIYTSCITKVFMDSKPFIYSPRIKDSLKYINPKSVVKESK